MKRSLFQRLTFGAMLSAGIWLTGCADDAGTADTEMSAGEALQAAPQKDPASVMPKPEPVSEFDELLADAFQAPPDKRAAVADKLVAEFEKDPTNPAIMEAIPWLTDAADAATMTRVLDQVLEHQSETDVFAQSLKSAVNTPAGPAFLEKVIAQAKSEDVQMVARYFLAESKRDQPEELDLLRQVASYDGDVRAGQQNLKVLAERRIYVAENFSIGVECPDIVGKDVHGDEFKLSDYRGKVVMLDFWGDW